MNSPTCLSQQEQAWVQRLANEARRDLVFLWHITGGRFGGPSYQASELPAALERVASGLIECGCLVGFGDPDSEGWQVPTELSASAENRGQRISDMWRQDPDGFQFLVFALRD